MDRMIAVFPTALLLCAAGLFIVWLIHRHRSKKKAEIPMGDELGLIAYRAGGVRPAIMVRRSGWFGTTLGGSWIGLITVSEEHPGSYETFWNPEKLTYCAVEGHRRHWFMIPANPQVRQVSSDRDQAMEELVLAEENHQRQIELTRAAQDRMRGTQ